MTPGDEALQVAEKVGIRGESGKARVAGANARQSFCDNCGPAEAVPLLQSQARLSFSAACLKRFHSSRALSGIFKGGFFLKKKPLGNPGSGVGQL